MWLVRHAFQTCICNLIAFNSFFVLYLMCCFGNNPLYMDFTPIKIMFCSAELGLVITKDIVSYFVVYRVKLGVTYHFVYRVKLGITYHFVYRVKFGVTYHFVYRVKLGVTYHFVYRVKFVVTYHFVYRVKVCANQRHYALFVYRVELGVNQRCVLFGCLELGKTLCPICLFTELGLVLTTDIQTFILFYLFFYKVKLHLWLKSMSSSLFSIVDNGFSVSLIIIEYQYLV